MSARLEEFRLQGEGISVFAAPVGTEFLFGVVGSYPFCKVYALTQNDGRAEVQYRLLVAPPGEMKPGHFAAIEKHLGAVQSFTGKFKVMHVFQLKPTKEI